MLRTPPSLRFSPCDSAVITTNASPRQGDSMLSRIRMPRGLPSIRRPRRMTTFLAVVLALSASSAFAQRAGGCGGISGGSGGSAGSTSGGFGLAGGVGGVGGGPVNSMAMASSAQSPQPMQGLQGMFLVPAMIDDVNPDGDHRSQLAARKAMRAAELEERLAQRQALRPERQTRLVASRTRPSAGRQPAVPTRK